MKNFRRINNVVWPTLITILVSISLSFSGCVLEYYVNIVIENQSDQVLAIHYAGGNTPIGTIAPGEQITFQRDANIGKYPITAKNMEGEVVFSQVFSRSTNLKQIGDRTYKGVIPPLQ